MTLSPDGHGRATFKPDTHTRKPDTHTRKPEANKEESRGADPDYSVAPREYLSLVGRIGKQQAEWPEGAHRNDLECHHIGPAQWKLFEQSVRLSRVGDVHEEHRA